MRCPASFSYTGAVNLNTTEHQLEFSGNFIYLGAKGNKLLTKPEPVPYNPDALLTYISYDTVEGTLVTADWSSSNSNDQRAVTIECASDMNEPYAMNSAVYNSLVKLCIDICKRNPNKTVEVLMDGWQVNGLCIRYHREKRKEKTAHTLMIRKRKAQERALLEQEA